MKTEYGFVIRNHAGVSEAYLEGMKTFLADSAD